MSEQQKQAVILNESIRHFMDENKPPLNFEPTKEQIAFFDGTEYGKPENRQRLKETIIARILTGDESAGNVTPEQQSTAQSIMRQFNSKLNAPPSGTFGGQPVKPAGEPYTGAAATIFGGKNDPADNGQSALGGPTGPGGREGTAIPEKLLAAKFPGKDKQWISNNVRTVVRDSQGIAHVLPIADYGTAEWVWKRNGRPTLDLTEGAAKQLGGEPVYQNGKLTGVRGIDSLDFSVVSIDIGDGPKKRVFPTKHPFVKNSDGSVSNVILSGEDILTPDGNYDYTIAFPTMIDGKRYTKEEAFNIAKKNGLENYPRFNSVKEMNQWAETNHGNIDENGFLKSTNPLASLSWQDAKASWFQHNRPQSYQAADNSLIALREAWNAARAQNPQAIDDLVLRPGQEGKLEPIPTAKPGQQGLTYLSTSGDAIIDANTRIAADAAK